MQVRFGVSCKSTVERSQPQGEALEFELHHHGLWPSAELVGRGLAGDRRGRVRHCCFAAAETTLAALLMLFSAYVAPDGAHAIVAAVRAKQRGGFWQAFVLEGAINLAVAAAVLTWPAMAAVAFLRLTSVWAIITGVLLIAAARRLSLSHGLWLLTLSGALSATWGLVASAWGPTSARVPETTAWWLLGYALPFAAALLALSALLQRRDQQAYAVSEGGPAQSSIE